jgi:hypothetical protein
MILPSFLEKFDVLFNDDEFGFKSDDKLLTLVMASLRLVNLYHDGIVERGVTLESIYFIHEGKLDVTYEPPD